MILCDIHKEILKYFCFECNKYYCSYCIKENNNLNHNDNHSCFSTLNISKSEFNEVKSLFTNFYRQNEILDEQKVNDIINEINEKKNKDLSIIYQLQECIKYRYDSIITIYENFKKELCDLKNDLITKYSEFKKNYTEGKFEPKSLSDSIFNINNKINIFDSNFESFFNSNEINFTFKIQNFNNILNNKIKEIKSPKQPIFFNDIYIIVYPYGVSKKSTYLELGIICDSIMKKNYDIKANIKIININPNKEYERKIEIDSYNKKIYLNKFYISSHLEKDGFIDNNGDLIINCNIEFNKDNSFLYDIQEYYETFINKNNKQFNYRKKIIMECSSNEYTNKKLFLGKKYKLNKVILDDEDNTEKSQKIEENIDEFL